MSNNTICFLITGLVFGGAEKQLLCTSIALKKRGWDVHVVSMCPPRAYTDEFVAENIPVYSLDMFRKIPDPRALFKFIALLRNIKPAILHSHLVHANIFARIVRVLFPVPVLVSTAHSIYEGAKWRNFAYRITDKFCDITTNVCQAGVNRALSLRIVSKTKIRYIPNGVDAQRFSYNADLRSSVRKDMNFGRNFIYLAVGRFEAAKDYPNMLRAFADVVKADPNVMLLLVGDGVLRREMEILAQSLNIADSVQFLGIRRDIPSLMNAADCYVMSSAWEGMPIVLLEAVSIGLPIVATDVGGNSDVVSNGINGLLVPAHDSNLLAEAMISMKNLSEEEILAMREAGVKKIAENFDIFQVVNKWEQLYNTLMKQKI